MSKKKKKKQDDIVPGSMKWDQGPGLHPSQFGAQAGGWQGSYFSCLATS